MPNILGINISPLSRTETLSQLERWLEQDRPRLLVTPNPEIILAAHHDEELFFILNKADLAPADGFGLKLAGWLYGENIPRLTGADLVGEMLKMAQLKKLKVVILNWCLGLSKKEDIKSALNKIYPNLDYLIIDSERFEIKPTDLLEINNFSPAIIFCNFGAPYQEKVLYHNIEKFSALRLAIGCGGAFDFLTGQITRAPKWLRQLGLEWLWRLIKQPQRWRRIVNAVFIFTAKVLEAKLISRFLYRPNVACLMYKQTEQGRDILIVERTDEPGHWQLPQGGTDGEDVTTAGSRELREETGTSNFMVKATYKNLHRYKFSNSHPIANDTKRHKYDYRGQKQSLLIAEFTGRDEEIKINFWDHRDWKWIPAQKLVETVHPARRQSVIIYLAKLESLN